MAPPSQPNPQQRKLCGFCFGHTGRVCSAQARSAAGLDKRLGYSGRRRAKRTTVTPARACRTEGMTSTQSS